MFPNTRKDLKAAEEMWLKAPSAYEKGAVAGLAYTEGPFAGNGTDAHVVAEALAADDNMLYGDARLAFVDGAVRAIEKARIIAVPDDLEGAVRAAFAKALGHFPDIDSQVSEDILNGRISAGVEIPMSAQTGTAE